MGMFNLRNGCNTLEPAIRYTVAQIAYSKGLVKTVDNKILAEFLYFTILHYFLIANGRFMLNSGTTTKMSEARSVRACARPRSICLPACLPACLSVCDFTPPYFLSLSGSSS
jgi:hypothetical protein